MKRTTGSGDESVAKASLSVSLLAISMLFASSMMRARPLNDWDMTKSVHDYFAACAALMASVTLPGAASGEEPARRAFLSLPPRCQ